MTEALATKIGIETIFYCSIAFCLAVSLFWPWWQSRLGWTIVAKSMALAIATLPAMVFFWFGFQPPEWLRIASISGLWLVPPILAWRALELWLVQRRGGQPL